MRAVSTAFRTHMVGIHFLAFIALGAAAFFAFIALGMVTGNWANSEVTCVCRSRQASNQLHKHC